MAQQINVNIRMDKDIKEQADALFNELGFNLTTAVNSFVRQALRERAIPFKIKANKEDYFNEFNMHQIEKSIAQLEAGNVVMKTLKELEDLENE